MPLSLAAKASDNRARRPVPAADSATESKYKLPGPPERPQSHAWGGGMPAGAGATAEVPRVRDSGPGPIRLRPAGVERTRHVASLTAPNRQ